MAPPTIRPPTTTSEGTHCCDRHEYPHPGPCQPRTLHVTWHPDAIRGALQRAQTTTHNTDPDQPCTITWTDLAVLTDIARTWIHEQETTP